MMDEDLREIIEYLKSRYSCHTVILYGSRAREEHRPTSDYDIIGISSVGSKTRDARHWKNAFLDVFIYQEDEALNPGEDMLPALGGLVLVQKEKYGDEFLARLKTFFDKGPTSLRLDELEAMRVWGRKMISRVREDGVEANYRRVCLLTALLEDYFHFRHLWWLGPKKGLSWLEKNDTESFKAFSQALEPAAGIEMLKTLVERVLPESMTND